MWVVVVWRVLVWHGCVPHCGARGAAGRLGGGVADVGLAEYAAGAGRACARAGLSGRGVSQREKPPPKRHRVARLPKHTMTCRKNAQAMSRFKVPLPNGGTMQVDDGEADVVSSAEVAAIKGAVAVAAPLPTQP